MATSTTAKEHLEYIIGISMEAMTARTPVLDLLNISTLIVAHLLLRVTQYRVRFTDVLKHLVRIFFLLFISLGMLVRMPSQRLSLVSFLDLVLGRLLTYVKELIVILPLRFLELKFRVLQLLLEPGCARLQSLHSLQILHGLLIHLQLCMYLATFQQGLYVVFIDFDGCVQIG